jgi:serine/threonine protein kinase
MSDPTQSWLTDNGPAAPAPESSSSPLTDPLPLTIVNDRPPVRAPVVTPVVFPGFEILGELGRGGMGVVYKARQRNLNRLVALKVILGGPLASEEDKARFRIEAEAAARLHHPNIVQVYDVGEYAGFSYMALELIEGLTLRQWQGGLPIDPKQAAQLVAEVARAIHHAHEQGIVHRDIKPANIILAPVSAAQPELGAPGSTALPTQTEATALPRPQTGGHPAPLSLAPKVTDFGLAKALDGGHDLTATGVACGTPNYMSPEQVRGRSLSPAVDVYALGAVAFELLTGRPPFVGPNPTDVLAQILNVEALGVRKLVATVPRDLAVIVAKCLEKSPAARYASARDLAEDLERFLANKPITARPIGLAERMWRWTRRNPVVTAFLVLTTLGCFVTGALALALARFASDERQARGAAEVAREDADLQRRAAESARDGLRDALAATELARQAADTARGLADAARESAKQDARRAGEKQKEADAARARAEDNLRVARGVIRISVRELSRHPRFEDEDFRDARATLIQQARSFRDTVSNHAPDGPEWLDDIADVSHWLGFLEYLNNNYSAAATEFKRAADAAGKWSALEPHRREPRSRQSFSLLNAGNALVNAHRLVEAEKCYRETVQLLEALVAERPLEAHDRLHAVEVHHQLANVLRLTNQLSAAEAVARQELERAKALVRACSAAPDHLRLLATAYQSLGTALAGLYRPGWSVGCPLAGTPEKWGEAERALAVAVALRNELRTANPKNARFAYEYGTALLLEAEFFASRGTLDRAGERYRTVVQVLEQAFAAAPLVNAYGVDLAHACALYADNLRLRKEYPEAERRYNQALELVGAVLRRAPTVRRAREVAIEAGVGRAHLYNATQRHREAAAEWARLAAEDPDPRLRPQHELFVMQSFLFAADWSAARKAAEAQMKKNQPGWMWLEMARIWCLVYRQIDADANLAPADKRTASDKALDQSVMCLQKARASGEFDKPGTRQWYTTSADLAPVRGKFDPDKK